MNTENKPKAGHIGWGNITKEDICNINFETIFINDVPGIGDWDIIPLHTMVEKVSNMLSQKPSKPSKPLEPLTINIKATKCRATKTKCRAVKAKLTVKKQPIARSKTCKPKPLTISFEKYTSRITSHEQCMNLPKTHDWALLDVGDIAL
jgi:hypothetical protein